MLVRSLLSDALLELRYAVEVCEEEKDEITRKLQNIIDEYDERCFELNKVIENADIVTTENFCKGIVYKRLLHITMIKSFQKNFKAIYSLGV